MVKTFNPHNITLSTTEYLSSMDRTVRDVVIHKAVLKGVQKLGPTCITFAEIQLNESELELIKITINSAVERYQQEVLKAMESK